MNSISNQAVLECYLRGYRVVNGDVFSPENKKRKTHSSKNGGYKKFAIRLNSSEKIKVVNVMVHRLVEKVLELRKQGLSYISIMKKLNISSKATINFIIRKSIQSKSI